MAYEPKLKCGSIERAPSPQRPCTDSQSDKLAHAEIFDERWMRDIGVKIVQDDEEDVGGDVNVLEAHLGFWAAAVFHEASL